MDDKYKLIRKLRGCPLPVGTVSELVIYRDAIPFCKFTHTMSPRYVHPPDRRLWMIPVWICKSMPYYFRKVRARKSSVSSVVSPGKTR